MTLYTVSLHCFYYTLQPVPLQAEDYTLYLNIPLRTRTSVPTTELSSKGSKEVEREIVVPGSDLLERLNRVPGFLYKYARGRRKL